MHNDGNISITYNDSAQYYSMNAHFSKRKTRKLEYYMDQKIGAGSNLSFVNTQSDAIFTLDDHTKFYLKKTPGHIEIKLDKYKNSDEAYHRIKSMCEGMKEELTR
jgi:hypothetical protein